MGPWSKALKDVPRILVAFRFAQLIDAFGSSAWALVFPLVTLALTHSALWTSLVTGAPLAVALFRPWIGAQIDRHDKRVYGKSAPSSKPG